MQEFVCCICGQKFMGWGNNPYPLVEDEDARCCDECDGQVVMARIAGLYAKERNND